MICCDQNLKIVTTINLGYRGKTKTGLCEVCHRRYTVVEMIVNEVKKRGDGAVALALKLREESKIEASTKTSD